MTTFIQLHLLTAYPAANLNRDDTGALHDPLIVGIYHFFQHGVGQDKIRNAGARADQFTVDDFHAPKKSKSLSQKAWKSDNS